MEIFWIFAGITVLGLVGYGFQILAVRSTLKRTGRGKGTGIGNTSLPGISVLKPLKGLDDNLFDNLESICIQDYPQYEIIFSLQDHNDLAYKVAGKIKDKYPDRDITVMVERCNAGLNPKVNNLIPAYRVAKYEVILISDSNVAVNRNYLRDIAEDMQNPEVGLVSNIIKGTGGRTFGAVFENLHMNSFVMGSVCFLDRLLKMPCVVGKSMLMRKKDLESIGGLKAVKDVLAEDYLIGKKLHQMGKKVVLSNHMISNVNEYWGIRKFLNRHTRWGKLRWKIGGISYLSELFSNTVFMSFLPLILWEASKITLSFALLVSSVKILGDFCLGRIIEKSQGNGEPAENRACSLSLNPLWYLLAPVKDLLIGLIWFVPILSTAVVWRGNRYVIGKDSVLSPCPVSGIWSWRYRFFAAIKARFA
jgi:ceramide glucosyltransferase